MLTLHGATALSEFRITKLLADLTSADLDGIQTTYLHFVDLERDLSDQELDTLHRVLTYGPAGDPAETGGQLRLVVPRPGTISPWSSKATDIAHILKPVAADAVSSYWIAQFEALRQLTAIKMALGSIVPPRIEDQPTADLSAQDSARPGSSVRRGRLPGPKGVLPQADRGRGVEAPFCCRLCH